MTSSCVPGAIELRAAPRPLRMLSWWVAVIIGVSGAAGCLGEGGEATTGVGGRGTILGDPSSDGVASEVTITDVTAPVEATGAGSAPTRDPAIEQSRAIDPLVREIDPEDLERRREAARARLRERHEEALRQRHHELPPDAAPLVGNTRRSSAENDVARLVPAVLEFGDMEPGVSQQRVVRIENISDEAIVIHRAIMSGGGHARAPKDPIAPGESVEIPLTLAPGSRQGVTHNKRVTFTIAGEPPLVLTLRGRVKKHVDLHPELLNLDTDDPASGRITLASVDGEPFRVLAADPSILREIPSTMSAEHVLEIDAKLWKRAGKPGRVSFSIDHPALQKISVMIQPRRLPDQRSANQ